MKFTIPKPPSVNTLYATNRYTGARYITAKGKAWFTEAGWEIRRQVVGVPTITTECSVNVVFYTSRFQDTDNIAKAIFDVLEDMKIVENDNLIRKHTIERVKVAHRKDEKVDVQIILNL